MKNFHIFKYVKFTIVDQEGNATKQTLHDMKSTKNEKFVFKRQNLTMAEGL